MGYPSTGVEGQYRNNENEVYKFFQVCPRRCCIITMPPALTLFRLLLFFALQTRHAGHYRIINLCSERQYNLEIFHGNVARYPFPDHNPPAMDLIMPCVSHIHAWLQGEKNNVVAVHCKAGKGRTGLVIICYLMYCGLTNDTLKSRSFYDWKRTEDGKGLTIISQIRYAHYFEEQLRRIKNGGLCKVQPRIPHQSHGDTESMHCCM